MTTTSPRRSSIQAGYCKASMHEFLARLCYRRSDWTRCRSSSVPKSWVPRSMTPELVDEHAVRGQPHHDERPQPCVAELAAVG